jgi:hypothetical protein
LTFSWFSFSTGVLRGRIKAGFCQTLAHRNWSVLLFLGIRPLPQPAAQAVWAATLLMRIDIEATACPWKRV